MEKVLESIIDSAENTNDVEGELELLIDQIELIQSEAIKGFVKSFLLKVHPAFWEYSSAMTEDDYPPDEMALHGTVMHVRRVVRFALEMAKAKRLNQADKDCLIAACLLHDFAKFMPDDYDTEVVRYNPYYQFTFMEALENIIEHDKKEATPAAYSSIFITKADLALISRLIRVHRGIWGSLPETIPSTDLEWIMHFADLLATRVHHLIDEEVQMWRWNPPDSPADSDS